MTINEKLEQAAKSSDAVVTLVYKRTTLDIMREGAEIALEMAKDDYCGLGDSANCMCGTDTAKALLRELAEGGKP